MVDFFRKEEIKNLKDNIAELEEENEKLTLQLGKKEEITRKSISSKQAVDRELNEYRQKILSLENELKKSKKDIAGELIFRSYEVLPKKKKDEIFFLLDSCEANICSLVTIYLSEKEKLESKFPDIASQMDTNTLHLIEKIESSTGKAIFYDQNGIIKLVFIPVFPVKNSGSGIDRKFDLEPLRSGFESDGVLVLNAHAGETFIGIVEGGSLIEHKIVRSSVMGKHSKGGFSQKRFERLIEEDVKHHADKVRDVLATFIERHGDIKYFISGGDGKLLHLILEGYNYPVIKKSMTLVEKKNVDQLIREIMSVKMYVI